MRIAVVGAGISGLVCAYLLSESHEVTLYEKETRLGGHTNTVMVRHEGRSIPVDTGFIVFNERNYPRFCTMLARLGVSSRPTDMSFSVRDQQSGFEYGGNSIAGLIGPWSNLLRPRWWRVISGVTSMGSRGNALLADAGPEATFGELCESGRFSQGFLEDYLVPMAAAIWSAPREALQAFPARFLLQFFDNHGMLDVHKRLQWRTITGGSRTYIDAMMGVIGRVARTGHGVQRVRRTAQGVRVTARGGEAVFDHVILASHADEALAMLPDASLAERQVLGAMPYQPNDVILHTDHMLLPRRRRCWAAWNYRLTGDPTRPAVVTYNMTMLQGLQTRTPLCVTLNDADAIDPHRILGRYRYHHPMYSIAGDRARARWGEISGVGRTHFCGAYWGNGFHEDGVVSALRVCERFGVQL
ncbi:MAG: FAD-dependent oxidoreductase [Planctomycetota bacterium]